ncbi:Exocyst complex component EXO70B1 [Spatholobus suberectus]|nr:Exocyst complex component EXO70B1 [Spatholobus suberectus]
MLFRVELDSDFLNNILVVIEVNSQQLARTDIDAATHDLSEGASAEQHIVIDAQRADIASMMQQLMTCMEAIQQGNWNLTDMLYVHMKKYLEGNSELAGMDRSLYEGASTGQHFGIDAPSSGTVDDLHEIAKRMFAGGFGKDWSHVYSSGRREFVEECISRSGFQKISIEDISKMPWQDLEDKIERWIKASSVAFRILFPSERRLCDRVFFGFSYAADVSFMEVCKASAVQLLSFAEALAIASRSPERLFRILDVFETLRDFSFRV